MIDIREQFSLPKAAFFHEPCVKVVERRRHLLSVLLRRLGVPKHDASLRSVCELTIHSQVGSAHSAHEMVIRQRVFRFEIRKPVPSRIVGTRPPSLEEVTTLVALGILALCRIVYMWGCGGGAAMTVRLRGQMQLP